MSLTNWTEDALRARLKLGSALDSAQRPVTTETAEQHLAMLDVIGAVDEGKMSADDAVRAFQTILETVAKTQPMP